MVKLFLTICITLFSLCAFSQFIVKDILAVDPDASIFDPEYNPTLNLVCWKSDNDNLWVGGLDPVTHMYKPADGKGTFVTANLSSNGGESWNGPEWMLSSQGTQIVYTKAIGGVRYPGVATKVLGGWWSFTLFQYPDIVYSMASANYEDSTARFLFETYDNDGIYWVENTDLNTRYYYPDVTLGFFARDNQQICCATNKSKHPGFIETMCNLPFLTSISQDTIGAPFMWRDPATNTRLYMYRTNGFKTLKIFQEIDTDFWVLYKQFNSPVGGDFQYITSPEPFTCGGRSYVSFMAAQSGSGKDGLPAEIWIAGADPADSLMRRVSDSTLGIRTDPEPVVFGDSAFVYYTDVISDKNSIIKYNVRKCDTGLGNLYTSVKTTEKSILDVSAFPNPGKGSFHLQSRSSFLKGSSVDVYDQAGLKVFSTIASNDSPELNLTMLATGNYILQVRNHNMQATTKVTIQK